MDYAARRHNLKRFTQADAIALVPGANMVYFTGLHFHLSERPIIALIQGDDLAFILPELEAPQIHARPDIEARLFTWNDQDGYTGAFARAIDELGLHGKVLGVDDRTMRVFELEALRALDPTLRVYQAGGGLLDIRAIKAAEEVETLQTAIRRSEAALDAALPQIKPGMSEREIGALLSRELGQAGCEEVAFMLIQIGENSAVPHGSMTDRKLGENEFLLIDYGGRFGGYPADITRTFCSGTPTAEMQRIYDTVLAANQAGIAAVKPGVACGDVDRAAREVIEAAGYGQYFIHRLGHGLGLEGHELPQMAPGVDDVLEVGMVFTVEPGIYVPGLGGVRIEDNVVVTEDGVRVLTSYRYGLGMQG